MGTMAWILGIIAALCTILGVVIAGGILPAFTDYLTPMFFLTLAGVLFLAAIASELSVRRYD